MRCEGSFACREGVCRECGEVQRGVHGVPGVPEGCAVRTSLSTTVVLAIWAILTFRSSHLRRGGVMRGEVRGGEGEQGRGGQGEEVRGGGQGEEMVCEEMRR